jgi:hypothetical protein
MKDKNIEPVKRLIEAGSNMIGGGIGNALGFVIAGAEGAAIGGVAGAALTGVVKVLGDVAHRSLSSREEARIGTAAYFAIEKIRIRLELGEKLREDDFFQEGDPNAHSDANEIFEGTLLKSKNEHQEKKIKFIANIFANTAFYSEISTNEANHILQVAENMTYRQMCLLGLFERKTELENIRLATKDLSIQESEDDKPIIEDISALQEIYQLYNLGLVACKYIEQINADGFTNSAITNSQDYLALITFDDVIPDQMVLTSLGKRYYSIMNLSEIPCEDLRAVAKTLST